MTFFFLLVNSVLGAIRISLHKTQHILVCSPCTCLQVSVNQIRNYTRNICFFLLITFRLITLQRRGMERNWTLMEMKLKSPHPIILETASERDKSTTKPVRYLFQDISTSWFFLSRSKWMVQIHFFFLISSVSRTKSHMNEAYSLIVIIDI